MIEIQINDQLIEVEPGSMIIEVADRQGIPIPRFCYHKKLSIAANCRMCLVEVEKAPKPLPACATPVTPGMKVYTQSFKAREAQKSVMEFLLINHPLDCPICDQGGECELQDLSLAYGKDISRFNLGKRAVKNENLGSLVATEMTRCIHCTRCVRFGQEIAGVKELGLLDRGEDMLISTYVEHSLTSELSGNIIDLCPVGALTSKPFRFKARPWELKQQAMIAPHDCVGSHLYLHTRQEQVFRVVPKENEKINETWISDRDRFSYLAIHSTERLPRPLIKLNKIWQEVDWETAFEFVVVELQRVKEQYGPKNLGVLASPSATLEEFYLLQKLCRGLGSAHIDHRLHQTDFSDQKFLPLYPSLNLAIDQLELQNCILLIGSNIHREQPLIGHRIRKAALKGAKISAINLVDYRYHFDLATKIITPPQHLTKTLLGVLTALQELKNLPKTFSNIDPSAPEKQLAHVLHSGSPACILLGAVAQNHPEAADIRTLSGLIAALAEARLGFLTEGANSAGAWLAGAVPHRGPGGQSIAETGLSAAAILASGLKSYILWEIEPELDCAQPQIAYNNLMKSEFNLVFSPFRNEQFLQYAHAILPITSFAETEGTFVNIEGLLQPFKPAIAPYLDSKPGWKVLRMLGQALNIAGFDYQEILEVRNELPLPETSLEQNFIPQKEIRPLALETSQDIFRITEWPLYSADSLVRRSEALQKSPAYEPSAAYLNAALAAELGLQPGQEVNLVQGTGSARLSIIIENAIPDRCVWVPAGRAETSSLGASFGSVQILK